MRPTCSLFLFLAVTGVAQVSGAQATIDPGMTKAQVVEKLGKPVAERTTGTSTFLFYKNGDERKVGMNDVVTLENGAVTDAVFRSSARKYSGKSSSPAAISAESAIKTGKTTTSPSQSSTANVNAPTTFAPKTATKPLPAAAAQAADVARPAPQARSAIRDKEKEAAAKAADSKTPTDSKAAVDPKAPPTKKP